MRPFLSGFKKSLRPPVHPKGAQGLEIRDLAYERKPTAQNPCLTSRYDFRETTEPDLVSEAGYSAQNPNPQIYASGFCKTCLYLYHFHLPLLLT